MTEHKWLTKSSVSVALASLALASTVTTGYLMFELKAMRISFVSRGCGRRYWSLRSRGLAAMTASRSLPRTSIVIGVPTAARSAGT